MPRAQNIVQLVEQAIQDYNSADTSNTLMNLQDIHRDVQPYAMMTKTSYVEFDPMSARAQLPACFTRDVGAFIGSYVILQDPKRNHIQVSIERKNNKIYFSHSWSRLKDFYGLALGGWVTVLYISPLLFHIKVRKITGVEVAYPEKDPPYRLMLLEQPGQGCWNGPIPYFVAPRTFCHTLEKTLTAVDVESGILELSWNGLCENALPSDNHELTIIDWLGYTWKCHLDLGDGPSMICRIHGEWRAICKARSLVEGVTLKFGVAKPSNNTAVYVKISPFIGVRTTLIAPTPTGGHKAFYQAEQYFML